jgi:hypothetical protein
MKVFEEKAKKLEIGQEAENFQIEIGNNLFLSEWKGSPIFLVFWKTL